VHYNGMLLMSVHPGEALLEWTWVRQIRAFIELCRMKPQPTNII